MKIIIGLGNPGKKYKNTRHNVGFMVLDALASKISNFQFPISNKFSNYNFQLLNKFNAEICIFDDLLLAKPNTFMNDSGNSVSKLATFYKIHATDIWVIHDDLDIKLGSYKIQQGHGPRLHNGVNSIEKKLKSENFWRVRIGVDNRDPNNKISGEEYVLQDFNSEEYEILKGVVSGVVIELTERIVKSK